MQVIGLCRFSYPALGGFQVEHDSTGEREAFLYGATRMEERFRLFETVALPCLRAQTDQDFTFIVVIGESLPDAYRARLDDLLHGLPQARIVEQAPGRHREVMKQVLWAARADPDAPCLQFRHDDDDAVAVDFVAQLRADVRSCAGLLGRHHTIAFDYNRGYIAELGPDGIAATEHYRPFNTAALAMYIRGGRKLSIMNFAHHKIPQNMPAVSFTDRPMYVRTHNGFNDSRQARAKPVALAQLTPAEEAAFESRFAIRADAVRRAFAPAGPVRG